VLAEADVFFSALKCPPLDMGAIEALRAGLAVVAADNSWKPNRPVTARRQCFSGRATRLRPAWRWPTWPGIPRPYTFLLEGQGLFMAQYTLEAFALRAAAAYADMLPAWRENRRMRAKVYERR